VQKYERQFQQFQIERNLLELQWGCCESREREFREMEGGGGGGYEVLLATWAPHTTTAPLLKERQVQQQQWQ
jgi:hypothetical protein